VLDCSVGHHIVNDLAEDPMLAVVETDDSGGVGDQAAVVYRGDRVVMRLRLRAAGRSTLPSGLSVSTAWRVETSSTP
jgi:hypothetical protein